MLKNLGGRDAMLRALKANPDRPDDPAQRAFEAFVAGHTVDIKLLTREQLSGTMLAIEWLDDLIEGLPNAAEVGAQLERAGLLQAFRKLVGRHFAGRENELQRLRDYIGFIPASSIRSSATRFISDIAYSLVDRPPLVIHGPGGVGKSTRL